MFLRLVSVCFLAAGLCLGQSSNQLPAALQNVGIDQKLGSHIPLGLEVHDAAGRVVRIGDYFGAKPVILAPVYYECPMLCTQVLTGLVKGLRPVSFNAGKEFEVVAVSFNPNEQPQLAAAKKNTYLDRYHRQGTAGGWHFLPGS